MILIAGATGYIGRYLCKYLKDKNSDILALGRSDKEKVFFLDNGIPFQYFDITEEESFKELPTSGVDCVINLAAKLAEIETPVEDFFDVNTLGTYKLLEYCRINGVRKFILASSHKVYNDIHKIPMRETDAPSFKGDHSPYIISKIAAENFVEYYNKDFDMQGIILRFTGVHGYGEILGKLLADGSYQKSTFELFIEKAIRGEEIEVWGDTKVVRDHIYIKDLIYAIEASIQSKDAVGVYNIATGTGVSQLDEAKGIVSVFSTKGKGSKIVTRPDKAGLSRSYVYSIEKAKRDLKWKPQYGLLDMLEDYKQEWERKLFRNYHIINENDRPMTL